MEIYTCPTFVLLFTSITITFQILRYMEQITQVCKTTVQSSEKTKPVAERQSPHRPYNDLPREQGTNSSSDIT